LGNRAAAGVGAASALHDEFLKRDIDALAAFKAAFANDTKFDEGINKIVVELDSHPYTVETVDSIKFAEKAKAAEKAKSAERRRARVAAEASEAKASEWLRKNLRQSQPAKSHQPAVHREIVANEMSLSICRASVANPQAAGPAAELQGRNPREAERPRRLHLELGNPASQRVLVEIFATDAARDATHGVFAGLRPPARLPEPGGGGLPLPPPFAQEIPAPAAPLPEMLVAGPPGPPLYLLLGVGIDATFEEIRKGFRREALRWHPDKNRERQDEATDRFKQITEAFDTLFDPQRRADYDAGVVKMPGRAKKLQGHGWSKVSDTDDAVLSKHGLWMKLRSWMVYWAWNGRIDDDPDDLVRDKQDPRYPELRVKLFWRWIGEHAYIARDEGSDRWLSDFIGQVWKDTPSRWPKAVELQNMNDASQQEWKERRMVFNRRKHKVRVAVDLHQAYLDIPGREQKEKERLQKMFPSSFGADVKWTV